jgi:ubiquinone/menaquinone biosynthesis C-methylase UbiE
MRIRDSDMPVEEEWAKFFNPNKTLKLLGINRNVKDVADFGCGYGTFAIPAAQMISGKVYALDIEPEMVRAVEQKAMELNLKNVVAVLRDFVSEGSGLNDSSVDFVFLFNILHGENPIPLLKEAYRILTTGGKAGIFTGGTMKQWLMVLLWILDPNLNNASTGLNLRDSALRNSSN